MLSEVVYLHYLNALLDGDKKQCMHIVTGLIDQGTTIKDIYLDLFQRSMYRIGQMWEKERCSIADEHVASNITEGMIEYVASNFSSENRNGKVALITCIDKEYHELGARMVAGFLEALGWRTIFLGANIPQDEVVALVRDKQPDIVGISSSFYMNINRLLSLLDAIKEEYQDQEIIVGGQSLSEGRSECLIKYSNVHYVTCLNGLEKYLSTFHNNRR